MIRVFVEQIYRKAPYICPELPKISSEPRTTPPKKRRLVRCLWQMDYRKHGCFLMLFQLGEDLIWVVGWT